MKWIIPIFLLGCVVVLLTTNYYFYKKALLRAYVIKLDPIGLDVYPVTSVTPDRGEGVRVLFYGDSRAFSWQNPDLEGYIFLNRAIGGQTSVQILSRFSQHVVGLAPDVMVLQLCVNDLKMIPLFPQRKRQIIDNCKKNLRQLVFDALAIKAKVILTTVFPLGDVSIMHRAFGIREQPIIEAIDEVNAYIHTLVDDNTLVFDAYASLKGEQRKIDVRYSKDWLHLNATGYERLNKRLVELLREF